MVVTSLDGRTIAGTYTCISSSEIYENLLSELITEVNFVSQIVDVLFR